MITLGDDNKPRSWSKYAPDSTAYKKEHGTLKSEEVIIQTEPKTKKKNKLQSEVEEKLKQVYKVLQLLFTIESCCYMYITV